YIENGILAFNDKNVGIVTGVAQLFGVEDTTYSPMSDNMEEYCCATSASLIRRTALDRSKAFEDLTLIGVPSEDWETWKRITRNGMKVAKTLNNQYYPKQYKKEKLSERWASQ